MITSGILHLVNSYEDLDETQSEQMQIATTTLSALSAIVLTVCLVLVGLQYYRDHKKPATKQLSGGCSTNYGCPVGQECIPKTTIEYGYPVTRKSCAKRKKKEDPDAWMDYEMPDPLEAARYAKKSRRKGFCAIL
ncbi:hypothetical protein OAM67_01475 [bacterium]|nr:hypothetical protein [bacterium]